MAILRWRYGRHLVLRPSRREPQARGKAQEAEGRALARSGGCVVLNPAFTLRCTFAPKRARASRAGRNVTRSRPSGRWRAAEPGVERSHGVSISNIIVTIANRSCAMGYGGNKQGSVTRRHFLKTTSAIAGAAGLAPALSAPFVSTALAQTKTLKVLQWSHFVPQFDTWFDGFAKDWGKKNGITVTVDHIPHLELPARAAAEVSAGVGHDIVGFNGSGGPHLYAKHTLDLTALIQEVEKKDGKVLPMGRQIAWNDETKGWSAFPDYFIDFPGLYRKALWDEIGMTPDTWEDVRVGGAK